MVKISAYVEMLGRTANRSAHVQQTEKDDERNGEKTQGNWVHFWK